MMPSSPQRLLWLWVVCVATLLCGTRHANADWTPLWSAGKTNGTMSEFGWTGDFDNSAPTATSAVDFDNDFYFAGSYPPPVNSVAVSEPFSRMESAFNTWNANTRIHFMLNAAQAGSTAQLRFFALPIWGGFDGGKTFGTHTFQVLLNGVAMTTFTFTYSKMLSVTFNASPAAIAGANTLELVRTGGSPNGGFALDMLGMDTNATALVDADNDGLPQAWEQSSGLSDSFAGDAAQDADNDGSTNAQEFTRGTHPQVRDTDGDGIADGAEVTTNPLLADTDGDSLTDGFELSQVPTLNPLAIDTDGDGAPDAWEVRVGTSATSSSSTPPPFASAIGVHFCSEGTPRNAMTPYEVAGLVPQMYWNNTIMLRQWDGPSITGSTADIASPNAGVLTNSAGIASGITVNWSADQSFGSGNGGSATQNLLDGGLRTVSDSTHATVTFSNIPFSTYQVIVYMGASYDGAQGEITCTNTAGATNGKFLSISAAPQRELIELLHPDPVYNSAAHKRRGNVVRFRSSGSTCTVTALRAPGHDVGIHAVQIVADTVDSDTDGMPDWYEVANKLRPNFNDAALDTDSDGLTNLQEYTRGTRADLADTDGDGLSDLVETNTHTYTNASNTGSDPLQTDSDGDGLSDSFEVNRVPTPLDPNNTDTDNDGVKDDVEIAQHSDPVATNTVGDRMPTITGTTAKTFDWTLYMQLVWNHEDGVFTDGEWGDSNLISIGVINKEGFPNNDAMVLSLRMVQGNMTALFYSNHQGAFSDSGNPTGDIWYSDWNWPPANIRPALGFSGYGRQDISDRLRYQVHGTTTGPDSAWTVTFSVRNLDTNLNVMSQTFNNCTLAANVHAVTPAPTWTDHDDVSNRLYNDVHGGIQLYYLPASTSPSLKTLPSFANAKDTDKDGMPDTWETANSFNPGLATDGPLDADNDGLSNVREYELGTNPRNADSDGDGVKDGIEVGARSNPLLASSKPPYWNGLPAGTAGEDLNGNGISDAYELWIGRFDLLGSADADGDGQSNAMESIAGTDPFDASSRLWSDSFRSGSDLVFRWPRLLNKAHQVLQSSNLSSWSPLAQTITTAGNEYRITVPAPFGSPAKFYHASVDNTDTDNDGVSDWTEANVLGSNSLNANSLGSSVAMDTNGDGTADTTLSGDYAALVQRLQGGSSTGGFPGGSTPATTTGISKEQASRFLMQATFGTTLEDIERVQQLGFEGWIAEQKTLSATLHSTYAKAIIADFNGPRADKTYSWNSTDNFIYGHNQSTAFARAAIQGSDQLRQRVAFALSQIIVTSRRDASLQDQLLGMADYYDIFVRNAFGSYRDILNEVSQHPCMGRYLSHVGNQKADPSINQYPDENYARELMQLFTIGLWELNPDGTRKVNGSNANIPTYSNTEITQLARVFTGFWFGQHEWGNGGWTANDYATPMTMHEDRHDFEPKTLVTGYVIPSRDPTQASALADVSDALNVLFRHPNTGPFVCKQLIQFLVTDNPSPAYVQRIAAVFANNGSGVRGDLGSVVKSILLDNEARNPSTSMHDVAYGRLKEPVMRAMSIGRAFGLKQAPNLLWWNWSEFYDAARQEPTYSPSVFNFYRPEYKAPGLLTANQKNGPVFQITDSYSSIAFPNKLWDMVDNGFRVWGQYWFPPNYDREINLAATPEKLADHMNLIFCAGQMSAGSRTILLNAINQIPATQPAARARVAAYLAIVCPEGAVMK